MAWIAARSTMAGDAGRKPRLIDVAQAAGVSVATVSRVLDDHPAITPETKARVTAMARDMGYPMRHGAKDKAKARARRPKRSGSICAVMPVALPSGSRLANSFEMNLLGGIGAAMRDHGLDFSVSAQAPYDDASLARFMATHPYDGIIFLGQSQFHAGLNLMAAGTRPFVVWGVETPDQLYCSVGSNNAEGGALATSHLIKQGRRRIAFIGQAAPITTAQTRQAQLSERLAGFRSALAAAGLPADLAVLRHAPSGMQAGAEAVHALLDQQVAFDAIVASSDLVAVGAMRALHERGRRVPDDVAIVGYDDSEAARLAHPQLTTIRQDTILAGHLLVSKLLRMMAGYQVRSERLPTELVIRESCGALSTEGRSAPKPANRAIRP
ncbi:LacI family DNA-binding transcriptional regulator [Novosphingobium sp. KACC 22771]|uniref:LacI family DNA-binding transcriptional regulator n=1 Tax=Novosphingobium sp. KACC 22771 TaxID=3025670 RepID=UPI002365F8CC|nr:LacI family DNA-binding transcriptional regulator [Novosphingobium sp. KACC 22771]WDF74499.1 LacI family DNA-binding transcriptional regulator [Novosphingobium sp. KACC 22771]